MQQLKWGIIGCGDVTEIKSGPAFNKVKGSSLVAVMRRDPVKAEDYARRHGVARWYSDAEALINDSEVNAIYIATPPLYHEEYTEMALAKGKPVYVEKPMTLNTRSAIRMKAASERYVTKLSVAHYRRQQPMFLKIKELLAEKVIGDVRFVNLNMFQSAKNELIASSENNWRMDPAISGGGLFHDLSPHQLDLMIYYFGEVSYSSGIALNQTKQHMADDLVTGHILFKNGIVFNGTWCFTVAHGHETDQCDIVGSKGSISFPMFGNKVSVTIEGQTEDYIFETLAHVQQPMIESVTSYFLGKGNNPCSADEAIQSMQLLDSFTSS
ncbi:MAG: Gfo/Idh/MocA family oxidoreductase [Pedobacter sp.]|nr:MAG: Gfo/Idh/MocA family oxidoreductase [Pedobacter sp.]